MQCGGTLVSGSTGRVSIHKLDWGRTIERHPAKLYTLANAGLSLRITAGCPPVNRVNCAELS
jgi:hypothetical protein